MKTSTNFIDDITKKGIFLYTNSLPNMWAVYILTLINHIITIAVPFFLIFMMAHLWFITNVITYIEFAFGYVVLGFIWGLIVLARNHLFYNTMYVTCNNISSELFSTVTRLPFSYMGNLPIESQFSRYAPLEGFGYLLLNDIVKPLLDLPLVIIAFSVICFILGFAYFVSVIVIFGLAYLIAHYKFSLSKNILYNVSEPEYNGALSDSLSNLSLIKAHGRTSYFAKKNQKLAEQKLLGSYINDVKSQLLDNLGESCLLLVYICSLAYAVYYTLNGVITIQYLVIVLLLSWFSISPIKTTLSAFNSIAKARDIIKQYSNLMQLQQPKHRQKKLDITDDYSGEISVQNVSFLYPNGGKFRLNNVSCNVKRGELLLINGHSGSGKSTLLKLIAGILNPTAGYITIDQDIRMIDEESLQDKIIMLSNKTIFEHSTVNDNLQLSNQPLYNQEIIHILNNLHLSDNNSNLDLLDSRMLDLKKYNNARYSALVNQIILSKIPANTTNKIILLDEPFITHDLNIYNQIVRLITQIQANNTIIVASRYAFYSDLAQHIVILNNGNVEKSLTRKMTTGTDHGQQ